MSFRLRLRRLRHQVSLPLVAVTDMLLSCTPRLSTPVVGPSSCLMIGKDAIHLREVSSRERDHSRVSIDILSDDALVEIFDFYANNWNARISEWHTLVHVCRRWRFIVFASPRRLNLRLEYAGKRPMSRMLDIWPVLPVAITRHSWGPLTLDPSCGNIAVALNSEHYNRICEIHLYHIPNPHWKRLAAVMQKSFPELTHLGISVEAPVVPISDSFLGGSVPRLRELWLRSSPFPGLQNLLLSTNNLVVLSIWDVPSSRYTSPQAIVAALSMVPRLETLRLGFHFPTSHPDTTNRPLPPHARTFLSTLTKFDFDGTHEYLEDLLAHIDAPLLQDLSISFCMSLAFNVPQLHRFIGHTERLKTFDRAVVSTSYDSISISFPQQERAGNHRRQQLMVKIKRTVLNWRISSLAQVCSASFPLLSILERLEIEDRCDAFPLKSSWKSHQWLELLGPFTAVKSLHLSHGVASHVCEALGELTRGRMTEVLPALHSLSLEWHILPEHAQKAIGPFVVARWRCGRPVTVHHLES
ncbi:hypothetical protein F5148DRAFT_253080 [Russula earlei]|uniref:Uncharacterized protein n=1 Tax=Russula earlei TaxID=71964 RepID=A0ACC0U4C8_9AGAM|nr:hypothetical protein F5148DRAFT_253080 [Russula earlei]